MSTSRSSPSSRSSSGVNFTEVGPRRPNTCTSVTGDAARPAATFAGISVGMRSSTCLARMRETSSATLPLPMTATSRASSGHVRGKSGCPSNQAHELGRAVRAVEVVPGTFSDASRTAPVAKITAL